MISQGIRLYTWVDVEKLLIRLQEENKWPVWLVAAQAYWDDLTLSILPKTPETKINSWLLEHFEPRLATREGQNFIILESTPGNSRELAVFIEEDENEGKPIQRRFVPSFEKPSILRPLSDAQHPAPFPADVPPLIAFHSFKGGVGRTTHAIALALALTETQNNNVVTELAEVRVLLVDADLEAPGITFLRNAKIPSPPVSYTDFLALVHSDPDPLSKDSIALVAAQLQGAFADGIYFLPAFRPGERFDLLEIKPEHLSLGDDPLLLTNMLAELGKALKVQAVIIDLRAGISELSAGILLDPRVYRVLVTTPSSQSIAGTNQMIELLAKIAPAKEDYEPLPALIISQVRIESRDSGSLDQIKEEMLEELLKLAPVKNEEIESEADLPPFRILDTIFNSELMVLPNDWDKVKAILDEQGMIRAISKQLPDWLPDLQKVISGANPEEVSSPPEVDLEAQRKQLADFAKSLIYAEGGIESKFLVTSPLRNLATNFANRVPIAVVVGAKGSGKTFSFLQLMRLQTWHNFANYVGASVVSFDAPVYAVFQSKNLRDKAIDKVIDANKAAINVLGFANAASLADLKDYVQGNLSKNLHDGLWRECWLNCLAWAAGFEKGKEGAGRNFVAYLRENNKRIIAVIDGLEDLFQDLPTNRNQQIALRSLLQDVPNWLGQQPSQPIGLIVFVRQDMVRHAIRQNSGQFMSLYRTYALRWDMFEALKLVVWITKQAGILPDVQTTNLETMKWGDLTKQLIPLWGYTLGTKEKSKEPPSAEWVITVLSDLKGQIQARDLVRFLHESAQGSLEDSLKDRILIPKAIREAIKPCSKEKIEEIKMENPILKPILNRLADLPKTAKKVPFSSMNMRLTEEEITILEDNGVILRVDERYEMPEIFRLGLEFIREKGRSPVLSLFQKAKKNL